MSRRSWVLFAAMCVIWGIPYLLIRVAVRDVEPATLVFLRTGIGGLILLPFALRHGGLGLVARRWHWLLAFSVIEIAGPWLLLSDAEQHLTSSLSGLLVAATPLVGVLVAWAMRSDDRGIDLVRGVGLLLGVVGVGMLVGLDLGQLHAVSLAEVALVVIGYAVAPVILSRKLADLPSLPVVCAALVLVAFGYLPYAIAQPPHGLDAEELSSIVVLGIVCTALAFVLFFALIAAIGPARATVITYVNPAVAVLLGIALLGEHFTAGMAVGFPLILAGSVLAARRRVSQLPIESQSQWVSAGDAQSIRTVPDGVANTAATIPVSSAVLIQSTPIPSSGCVAEVPK
jgi:drug/metabolite transporter (DMT)-like permease